MERAPAGITLISIRSAAEDDLRDGARQDHQIKQEGLIVAVGEIVFHEFWLLFSPTLYFTVNPEGEGMWFTPTPIARL